MPSDHATDAAAEVAAVMKKAGLVWLSWDGRRAVPAWFATVDGAYVVLADSSGGAEQPLPGLVDAATVQVLVPSKPATQRLATWTANVRRLDPGTEEWLTVAHLLRTERLNAEDLPGQLERWRTGADLLVLEPAAGLTRLTGEDDDRAEVPPPTPATTRGRRPFTLHRRSRRHPKLS